MCSMSSSVKRGRISLAKLTTLCLYWCQARNRDCRREDGEWHRTFPGGRPFVRQYMLRDRPAVNGSGHENLASCCIMSSFAGPKRADLKPSLPRTTRHILLTALTTLATTAYDANAATPTPPLSGSAVT